jgi:hypothetical protein
MAGSEALPCAGCMALYSDGGDGSVLGEDARFFGGLRIGRRYFSFMSWNIYQSGDAREGAILFV